MELAALERPNKIPIDLEWENCVSRSSRSFLSNPLTLAVSEYMHKHLDEFEFQIGILITK